MDRHLTVSGFVVHEDRVALHWHRKLGAWLPAGGHVEPGEDPVQATLREVREEFGLEAEVMSVAPRTDYRGGPPQIEPPYTILNCEVEPGHQHVDMVYFCRLVSGYPGRSHDPDNPVEWVDEPTLLDGEIPVGRCGADAELAPDVRALAIEAIRLGRQVGART
jgi:8-oxo-dGTP pyrophosphatase MutT (NUDIX family)